MCGIAGILTHEMSREHLLMRIQPMQDALHHRGPDDQGVYLAPDHQAAIAHTRLSILDLSAAGHQPMATADDRYWITFNGEIYNFQELRVWLQAQGEIFCSQTDTEVILKLYQRLGADCLRYLRGMFAFGIWDNLEKTCFIARDPLGIKPLYYWQSGSTLLFASEVKVVLASRLPTVEINLDGFYGYLTSGSVPEPHTLIAGIYCLEAGHWMRWQAGQLTQSQYWQLDFSPEVISPAEAQEKVRLALFDSIKHHFVSDVPVGIFLSGGIDSTAVVALSRKTQPGELRTYSIAFEEPEWNEAGTARQVAKEFDTHHTEYTITAPVGQKLFSDFLSALDQPTIDGFNTFCVSQVARQDGTKVVLSGLGGDELFGGYKSFQKIPQMVAWGKYLSQLGIIKNVLGSSLEYWGQSVQTKRLGGFLRQTSTSTTAYQSLRGVFDPDEASVIISKYFPDHQFSIPKNLTFPIALASIEDEISFLEISRYMRNQLLRDSDVMSMASGLELRVPFVDRAVIEAIGSIPSSIRLAAGKQLLVEALPELPSWIVNQPKRGFLFPFDRWFEQEWHGFFDPVDCPLVALKPWYRRWSLAMFEYWWNRVTA